MKLMSIIFWVWVCAGCSTLKFWEEEPAPPSSEVVPTVTDSERMAKLWTRIDELSHEVSKQKQRIAVLERGLLLGVIPDELRHPAEGASHQASTAKSSAVKIEVPTIVDVEPKADAPDLAPELKVNEGSEERLLEAQKFFEQAQYGRAIAIYSTIDDNVHAEMSHRYWMALSWFRLKEYDQATKEFEELERRAPASPWIPRAHYYQAQIDLERGLKQKALKKFQEIIEKYPQEDAAQMARTAVERMEKNL